MQTKNKIFIILFAAGIFLSMVLAKETDPIDILLKRTTDTKLKEKILVFKKGGYERVISFKKHDVEAIIKSQGHF